MDKRVVNRAYLSLGSNIEPETHLPSAVRKLAAYGRVAAVSRVWETAPVGFSDQPNYLNAAVLLETTLSAREICLEAIPQIERDLHRIRNPENKNAPRTIDVDLVLFNREILTRSINFLKRIATRERDSPQSKSFVPILIDGADVLDRFTV